MHPRVGVVIPLYNKASCIIRAIESVLSQSFRDYDLIVVDDGSTDSGPDLVRGLNDSRITLISQENAGPGAARNRGAAHGSHEFLAFLDADDEWFDGYLARAVAYLEGHPECAAVVQNHLRGETGDADHLFAVFGKERGVWSLPSELSGEELKRAINACHTSASVCRKHVFDRYGGFYDAIGTLWAEDAFFWLQVLLNHPIYVDKVPGAWYHTEDSDLYWNIDSAVPPEPAILENDRLFRNCPSESRPALTRYLKFQALSTVRRLTRVGDFANSATVYRATMHLFDDPGERFQLWATMYGLNRIRGMLQGNAVFNAVKRFFGRTKD